MSDLVEFIEAHNVTLDHGCYADDGCYVSLICMCGWSVSEYEAGRDWAHRQHLMDVIEGRWRSEVGEPDALTTH